MVDPTVERPACCAACAAGQGVAPSGTVTGAVRAGPPPIRRGDDRRVTFAGLAVAAGLLASAAIVLALTSQGIGTIWVALHLALAGAAATAIAAVLPFFTTALAQGPPAPRWARALSIGLVAGGAVAVALGGLARISPVAVLGGGAFIAGMLGTAMVAFGPLRSRVGRRSRLVTSAYAVAIGCVIAGAALGTSTFLGWSPVLGAWASLKPAHACLNVFGFVALVVAATLVHLAPTVEGTRIRARTSARSALVALMLGAPILAAGFAGGWDIVARLGAVAEIAGAVALVVHGLAVHRDHGRWTTDLGWHRMSTLSLLAGTAWFLVAVLLVGGRVLLLGAAPTAWSLDLVVVPLVAGWITQVLVGAWTHLVPAIGPGEPAAHAAQRRLLGWAAGPRLIAWNTGVAIATVGTVAGGPPLVVLGAVLTGASLVTALVTLVAAAIQPRAVPVPVVAPRP